MSRTDFERLHDMLDAAEKARKFCAGMDRPAFFGDDRTQLAVVRCLHIVGEAAWRTNEVTRRSLPAVPWSRIAHMRHRLTHDYFQINLEIVWRTVQDDLPPLVTEIRRFLRAMEAGS